ncbi:hypothetical protein V6Z11_A04G170000 [Gossypium hirsutum]
MYEMITITIDNNNNKRGEDRFFSSSCELRPFGPPWWLSVASKGIAVKGGRRIPKKGHFKCLAIPVPNPRLRHSRASQNFKEIEENFRFPLLRSSEKKVQRPDGVEARSGGIGSMAVTWH